MRKSTRALSFILAVVMVIGLVPMMTLSSGAAYDNKDLKFNSEGKFVLLQISDIQDDNEIDERTLSLINKAVARFEPDMAVLTGDNVTTKMNEAKFKSAADQFLAPLINNGVEFAVTFGNHDSEGNTVQPAYSRQNQYDYYVQKGGIDFDEESLSHVGSGAIPIYSNDGSRVAFCVFPMDTGDYDGNGNYDHVAADQNAWFESESARLKALNNGSNVPTLVFQHIPVPEIYDNLLTVASSGTPGAIQGTGRWQSNYYVIKDGTTVGGPYYRFTQDSIGVFGEGPCPSDINGNQYQSWLNTGNVAGAFYGHDHKNSFVGTDANGITMGYCKAATLNSYNDNNPGVRVFFINEDGTYTTKSVTEADINIEERPEYNHDEIGGTPTVPNILYVGAADNGLAKQATGNTIQTTALNYKTLGLYENDLEVSIDLSKDATNVSLEATYGVNITDPTVTDNADGKTRHYSWTITGGTAVADSVVEYIIKYTYDNNSFEQRAYSYVEGVKTPAGHYVWNRNYRGGDKSGNYTGLRVVYTVTGANVFGKARSQTDDALSGGPGNWTNAPSGYYNFTAAEDAGFVQGSAYAINFCSPDRIKLFSEFPRFAAAGKSPQATVYVDSSDAASLADVGVSLNYYRHSSQDNNVATTFSTAFKSGDVSYTASTWNTGTVSAETISATAASVILSASKGAVSSQSLTGTIPADGTTVTMITQGYTHHTGADYDTENKTFMPVLLKFVTYDKGALRTLVNAERAESRQAFSYNAVAFATYQNAFKEAYRQLNQINTTQNKIDNAVTRLNDAVTGLTKPMDDISDNSEARLGAKAPSKIYVAGKNYSSAQQPQGTYIQPSVINYKTGELEAYTAFQVTLPEGADTPTCKVTRLVYDADGEVTQEVALDSAWDSGTRTCSLVASDKNQANPGDVIKYAFTYRLNNKTYTQYEASYVAAMPTPAGWLTFIRRKKNGLSSTTNSQETLLFVSPVSAMPDGAQFITLQADSGVDNAVYSTNLTNFSGTGNQAVPGIGIGSWTSPSRASESSWYSGADSGKGDYHKAKFELYADSSVINSINDMKIMYRAIALTSADDGAAMTQYYNHFQSGENITYQNASDDPNSNFDFATPNTGSWALAASAGKTLYSDIVNAGSQSGLPAAGPYGMYVGMKSSGSAGDLACKYSWGFTFSTTDKTALRNAVATEDAVYRQLSDGYNDTNGKFTNYINQLCYAKAMVGNLSCDESGDANIISNLEAAVGGLEYNPADYTAVKAKVDQVMKVKVGDQMYSYYEWKPLVDAGTISETDSVRCYRPFETNDPTYYATEQYYPYTYYRSTNEVDIPINNIDWTMDVRYQSAVDAYVNLLHVGWESVYLNNADYSAVDNYLAYQKLKDGVETIRLNPEKYDLPEAREYLPYTYYTTATYQDWADAYMAGSTIRSYMSPEQTLVDTMAANLATAYANLELKSADYTELNALVAEVKQNTNATVTVVDPSNAANNYTISYYDPAYVNEMTSKVSLIDDGLTIINQADIDQVYSEIDAMYIEMGNHLNVADYTFANAQKAIKATYEDEYEKYYTAESWNTLVTARNAIKKGKMAGEQDTVNGYAKAIYDARSGLVYNPADYTVVNEYLKKIAELDSNNYANWNIIDAAVKAVDKTKNVTQQADVDTMAANLKSAYDARTLKDADYTALLAQIEAANALDASLYTTGSYSAVTEKLAAANTVKNHTPVYNILEQAAVTTAADNLKAAIEGLKYKDATIAPLEEALLNYYSVDEYSYTEEYGEIIWANVAAKSAAAEALKQDYEDKKLDIRDNQRIIDTANALTDAIAALPALYSGVTAAKAEIPKDLSNFTDASVAALNKVLNGIDYTLKIADQDKVYEYENNLYEAIYGLTLKPADLTALKAAITAADAKIKDIDTAWYTEESWSKFEEAYNTAVDIRDADPAYDIEAQQDVTDAAAALTDATGKLAYVLADYSALNELLENYSKLTLTDYTPASVTASDVVAKYNAANGLAKDLTIDQQATVTAAANALDTAMKALVLKADKTGLDAAIKAAQAKNEADYTPNSWADAALAAAISTALDVYNNDNATAVEVAAQIAALNTATGKLLEKADKTQLSSAITTAEGKNEEEYTTDSWAAADLANVIAAAKQVEGDANATQAAVDAQVGLIDAAVKKLVLRPTKVELIPKENTPTVVDTANNFIYGLEAGAGLTDILEAVAVDGDGHVEVAYFGNNQCVGTGTVVNLFKGDEKVPCATFTVIIFGDNNGDGEITDADANDFLLYNAWLDCTFDYEDMTVANVFALDLNHDGMVTDSDMNDILLYNAWLLDDIPQTITVD